jgi:hypothetical protein
MKVCNSVMNLVIVKVFSLVPINCIREIENVIFCGSHRLSSVYKNITVFFQARLPVIEN